MREGQEKAVHAGDLLALDVKGLTKEFGSRKALSEVTFQLPQGAFLSVFGPNGAGKTTLLRILASLSRASAGSASLLGIDLLEQPEQARGHIGLISHEPMLYPDLSAWQNLMFFAELYGVEDPETRVMGLLEAVELKARRFDAVRTFSKGMTQRMAIARALIHDPSIVFLDEPYSGLDPHAVEVFDRILAQERQGKTFVMVSHDMKKGFDLCTHVLLLSRGKLVRFAAKEDVDAQEFFDCYRHTVGMEAL